MANCPRCKALMDQMATICPACGYDFPESTPARAESSREGLMYSTLATLALIVGQIVAGLACLGSLVVSVLALFGGQWTTAFLYGPITMLLMFAMVVVFGRVLDLGR
jgi:hypothetical protein